jgi:type VI secretion system protein ImpB
MGDSYQHEIPKGRVNLKLEIKTEGGTTSVELPHKTLVLADFSNGKGKGPVLERKRYPVTALTRDEVMAELAPELHLAVPNTLSSDDHEMQINLVFQKLSDFHPESLVEQLPSLKRLLAMRHLLKELRSNLIDNHALKEKLSEIIADPKATHTLRQALALALPED